MSATAAAWASVNTVPKVVSVSQSARTATTLATTQSDVACDHGLHPPGRGTRTREREQGDGVADQEESEWHENGRPDAEHAVEHGGAGREQHPCRAGDEAVESNRVDQEPAPRAVGRLGGAGCGGGHRCLLRSWAAFHDGDDRNAGQ